MKTPTVEFRFSEPYERILGQYEYGNKEVPVKSFEAYISRIEPVWRKIEKKCLTYMSQVTKLKWEEDKIKCYIMNGKQPFSDPLTIGTYEEPMFIECLIHELIHVLLSQKINEDKELKYLEHTKKKYPNHSNLVYDHILLYAVFEKLHQEIFNRKDILKSEYENSISNDYKIAIKIVIDGGSDEIIEEFLKIK